MTIKNKKTTSRTIKTILLASLTMTLMIPLYGINMANAVMYESLNGLGGPSNFEYIRGTISTPSPTFGGSGHKDYMVFVSDALTGFSAGSGIYIQKIGTTTTACFLKLFANDPVGIINLHYTSCSTPPSGNIAVKVEQTVDEGYTWKGTSGGLTQTYTFVNAKVKNPPYFGSIAGSSINDTNLYSIFTNLNTKKWGSAEQTFSATTTLQKCFRSTGYNFDYNTNVNNVRTGPPTITVNECTQQQDDYRPHGEWD